MQVAQHTEELKEANASTDKFVSIIAHDLRNPFNTLLGLSDTMLENWQVKRNALERRIKAEQD
nr:histidine kinase dimerization/phospho-acceptor domain-containing protein [uncultured Draconibacterium sp.]